MKNFMDEEFLLSNETAKTLYHDYAAKMPVIDYHCHINPEEIANNRRFENITQVWLGGDHYKWRIIRANGIDEKYITGDSTDREKFQMFAETLPKAIGNPLYHWTHLELKRYFGYDGVLNADTAEEVWNLCNAKLKTDALSVRGIIEQSNVKLIATTDDPIDTLKWHKAIKEDKTCKVKVIPAWRPDKIMNIEKPTFAQYVSDLAKVSNVKIDTVKDVYAALQKRLDFFAEMGCKASDHGMNYVMYNPASEEQIEAIFAKGMAGKSLTAEEVDQYKYAILLFLGKQYAKRGWVMQLHYGTIRDTNTMMFKKLGPDTGFDSIATHDSAKDIVKFFDALNLTNQLPKTILYSLNPADDEMLDAIAGCFQGTEVAGKMQHGAPWWFNDTKTGMVAQMTSLANLSVLGNFIGMLTDSRSFLSYTRHEYFRRILCNLIGTWVENGEYPCDMKALGQMVQDISFNNASSYFGFDL
jgi:glucuronate isomerase